MLNPLKSAIVTFSPKGPNNAQRSCIPYSSTLVSTKRPQSKPACLPPFLARFNGDQKDKTPGPKLGSKLIMEKMIHRVTAFLAQTTQIFLLQRLYLLRILPLVVVYVKEATSGGTFAL